MNVIRLFLVVLIVGAFAGCVEYPHSRVDIPDERPSIGFKGATGGGTVYVDGVPMGTASDFDGKRRALRVETGPHTIEIRNGERVMFSQRLFLSPRATRILVVR